MLSPNDKINKIKWDTFFLYKLKSSMVYVALNSLFENMISDYVKVDSNPEFKKSVYVMYEKHLPKDWPESARILQCIKKIIDNSNPTKHANEKNPAFNEHLVEDAFECLEILNKKLLFADQRKYHIDFETFENEYKERLFGLIQSVDNNEINNIVNDVESSFEHEENDDILQSDETKMVKETSDVISDVISDKTNEELKKEIKGLLEQFNSSLNEITSASNSFAQAKLELNDLALEEMKMQVLELKKELHVQQSKSDQIINSLKKDNKERKDKNILSTLLSWIPLGMLLIIVAGLMIFAFNKALEKSNIPEGTSESQESIEVNDINTTSNNKDKLVTVSQSTKEETYSSNEIYVEELDQYISNDCTLAKFINAWSQYGDTITLNIDGTNHIFAYSMVYPLGIGIRVTLPDASTLYLLKENYFSIDFESGEKIEFIVNNNLGSGTDILSCKINGEDTIISEETEELMLNYAAMIFHYNDELFKFLDLDIGDYILRPINTLIES